MEDKKHHSTVKSNPEAAQRYYDNKKHAMDDLLEVRSGHSKRYSSAELDRYRKHKGIHLSDAAKVMLIKAWFAGAVCFFFFWGLGIYLAPLDSLVILGIAMGFVTDILVNNAIRFFEQTPHANDRWMMFPRKSYLSLVLNILYAGLILFCVYSVYNGINSGINILTNQTDAVPLGVEPVLFGLMWLGFDSLFIFMKHTMQHVIQDARKKVESGSAH